VSVTKKGFITLSSEHHSAGVNTEREDRGTYQDECITEEYSQIYKKTLQLFTSVFTGNTKTIKLQNLLKYQAVIK
jgi:hypothetical protein